MSLVLRVSQVPDWERRAIRLSLALVFFTSLGLTLWLVPGQYREEWGDEVVQSCNWAGATCAVVAASPLVGKVAQLSYERTLGTMTGGLLGFLVYDYGILLLPDAVDQVFMVCCAAAVGFASCWLSNKYSLDASMRLFVITFLIVTFGAHSHDSKSALGVALLRTGGIIAGVLLMMGLTIIVLPKSATIESLRELKKGLKLLTELNTLVWTSKTEAEATLKAAAAKARAAEAAAAAVAATGDAQPAAAAAASSRRASRPLHVFFKGWFGRSRKVDDSGYVALPDADPEAGPFAAAAAAAPVSTGAPAQAARGAVQASFQHNSSSSSRTRPAGMPSSNPHNVSQLTQALQLQQQCRSTQHSTTSIGVDHLCNVPAPIPVERSELLISGLSLARTPAAPQLQQEQLSKVAPASVPAAIPSPSFDELMEEYEVRCEAVLTSVYQSMSKVKDHMALADSEIYVFHFWGHYIFLPMFFNRAVINWLLPKRWKLPTAHIDDLATSIRVLARLLWTVHLDYSQGFDAVLAALPPAANMQHLLLELGEAMSAALGVLVEAFPNRDTILVDSFDKLDVLVDRILEVSESTHAALVQNMAANRPKIQRPIRSNSMPTTPLTSAAVAAAATVGSGPGNIGPGETSFSTYLAQQTRSDLGRPGAAAVAAADAVRSLPRFRSELAATDVHITEMPSRQVAFVTFGGDSSAAGAVLGSHSRTSNQLFDSLALEGLHAPIPTDSPRFMSPEYNHHHQQQQQQNDKGMSSPLEAARPPPLAAARSYPLAAARSPEAGSSPAAAAAAAAADGAAGTPPAWRIDSQAELMFDVSDLLGSVTSVPQHDASAAAAAEAGHRSLDNSHVSSAGAATADQAAVVGTAPRSYTREGGTSLIRTKFKPNAVLAAVKLQRAGHAYDSTGQLGTLPSTAAALTTQEQDTARRLLSSLSTVSAPDPATAHVAALLLQPPQQQQQQHVADAQGPQHSLTSTAAAAGRGGAAGADGGIDVSAAADNRKLDMDFYMLTRWYSFQFLMAELVEELDDLYCSVQRVLSALPHGL